MTMVNYGSGGAGGVGVYTYSNSSTLNNYSLAGHTHNCNDVMISYQDKTVLLGETIVKLQEQVDSIIDFLKVKGIIIDEEEFREFVVSRKLMKKMEETENG